MRGKIELLQLINVFVNEERLFDLQIRIYNEETFVAWPGLLNTANLFPRIFFLKRDYNLFERDINMTTGNT